MSKQKESNIVQLNVPKEKDAVDRIVDFIQDKNPESFVVFGIGETGQPFVAHTPIRTVPKLIVYLDVVKQLLQDELISIDANEGYFEYNEQED
jgi:hypothetical protein